MWQDYKDKTLETNIKNLSLFGDKHEVEYTPRLISYMDSVSRGGKRKKSKKGKKRKTRGKMKNSRGK